MNGVRIKTELFATLPPPWPEDLRPRIQAHLDASRAKVVVLDDDPTGTQTVHDIPVLTEWSHPALCAELEQPGRGFFILTNSRAFASAQACRINREIGQSLARAAAEAGCDYIVISRSDSTLRGHFPAEVDALGLALMPHGVSPPPVLLCPYFEAGGRFTIGDVHYVAEDDRLVPAAESAFARDVVFGYRSSHLREWVAEKTGGRIPASAVKSISLDDVRSRGPDFVAKQLLLRDGDVCVANVAGPRDLEVIVLAALLAEARGARTLYRTAASFVAARMGLGPRALLSGKELKSAGATGGLIVVGSYVPKTTEQLDELLRSPDLLPVELPVPGLLGSEREVVLDEAAEKMRVSLSAGRDVVLFTSRSLVTGQGAAGSLDIGARVCAALVELVRRLTIRPRFIVAKGGITSSDLATKGLGVKRAMVRGQILPGVPVWELGAESRFPGLRYVVFPGNVGGTNALAQVREVLRNNDC